MIGYPRLLNSSYLFQSTVHIYIPNQEILSWEMFQAAVIVLCSQNCSNCYRVKLTQWILLQSPLQCSLVSQPLYWHYIDQSFLKATEDWNCEPSLKLSVGLWQTVNIYQRKSFYSISKDFKKCHIPGRSLPVECIVDKTVLIKGKKSKQQQ